MMTEVERELVDRLRQHIVFAPLSDAAALALWDAWSQEAYGACSMDYSSERRDEFWQWAVGRSA